jgi:phage repressor protein C with HTH and peptisase S24 domain
MVETDRKELNQRFISVYKLLEERGEIVRNHPQKSRSAFAERILGSKQYGHIVSQFLSGQRHIDYKHARKLCSEYGINISYLIDGIGEPFEGFVIPPSYQMEDMDNASHRIMYTSVEAFAGTTIGAISPEQVSYFTLPNMRSNNLVAFNIKGNSMEPVINNTDIVICEPVEYLKDIKDNKIYAVKHDGKLWVKYLKMMKNKNGEIELTLISANYLEHAPFTEIVDYNTRIYKVVRKISSFE